MPSALARDLDRRRAGVRWKRGCGDPEGGAGGVGDPWGTGSRRFPTSSLLQILDSVLQNFYNESLRKSLNLLIAE